MVIDTEIQPINLSVMKQIKAILYLAVLTAMVSACSEDELAGNTQPSGKVPMEFYANTDASTRTELTTENAVYWEANDAISLFDPKPKAVHALPSPAKQLLPMVPIMLSTLIIRMPK